jgi:hypothetical protein
MKLGREHACKQVVQGISPGMLSQSLCFSKQTRTQIKFSKSKIIQTKLLFQGFQNKEAPVQAADASLVAGEVAKLRDALRQSQQHVDSLMGQASSAASTQVTAQQACLQCCHILPCICKSRKYGMPG